MTWPIYKDGTIGQAKKDLEKTAHRLDAKLVTERGGRAWLAVNKAVVTQASAAIPVVPLYISLLGPALKSRELEEGPIEQMWRLFRDYFAGGSIAEIVGGASGWTIARCAATCKTRFARSGRW